MVAGAHHVGKREQRRHQRVVLANREDIERAVGTRDAHRFRLRAGHVGIPEEAAVDAGCLQSLLAEHAGAVGERKRHDDDVAGVQGPHIRAHVFDDSDCLVAHDPCAVGRDERLVRPEVGAADAGSGDPDHRVGRLLDGRVGDVLDADVARCVHDGAAHQPVTSGACAYCSSLT